jgi:hypothetical protein
MKSMKHGYPVSCILIKVEINLQRYSSIDIATQIMKTVLCTSKQNKQKVCVPCFLQVFLLKMCLNKNHNKNRLKVCLSCIWKATRGPAGEYEITFFQENGLENYDPDNLYMPCGICTSCHCRFHAKYDHTWGGQKAPVLTIGNYEVLKPGKTSFKK